jgi:cell division protein FtsL
MRRRIRLRGILIFTLASLSGAALLYTSQNVQQADMDLNKIKSSLRQEEDSIRVLEAEWAYLNSPLRLEELATEYLKLKSAEPDKILQQPSVLPDTAPGDAVIMQEISLSPPKKETVPLPGLKPARNADPAQKDFRVMLKEISKEDAP